MVTPQHIDKLGNFLSVYSHHDQMAMLFGNGVDQDSQYLKLVLFTQGYNFVKSVYFIHDGYTEKYALTIRSCLGNT